MSGKAEVIYNSPFGRRAEIYNAFALMIYALSGNDIHAGGVEIYNAFALMIYAPTGNDIHAGGVMIYNAYALMICRRSAD